MDHELKAKWVNALRSGEYKQGQGTLNCKGKQCCLGVLCIVAGIEGVVINDCLDLISYDGQENLLTIKLRDQFGLSTQNENTLIDMNDGGENSIYCTFTQIADWIEENL